jgi:hypothetical protein
VRPRPTGPAAAVPRTLAVINFLPSDSSPGNANIPAISTPKSLKNLPTALNMVPTKSSTMV